MHTDVQVSLSGERFFSFIWRFLVVGCLVHPLEHNSMHGVGR